MSRQRFQFVAYVDNSPASKQFLELYGRLPQSVQGSIQVLDIHQAVRAMGTSAPAWLEKPPVLATMSDNPTVRRGKNAVAEMNRFVQSCQTQPQRPETHVPEQPRHAGLPQNTSTRPVFREEEGTLDQSTDEAFTHGVVVHDDLYRTKMSTHAPSSTTTGKITERDIAAFHSQRDTFRSRRGMHS